MPGIHNFYCLNQECDFEMPSGWGWYMYAIADDGERIRCRHPGQQRKAREVIGWDVSEEEFDRRTGVHNRCFCCECHEQIDLDPERDEKECPHCHSSVVKNLEELVDDPCPICEEGIVVDEDTGAIA